MPSLCISRTSVPQQQKTCFFSYHAGGEKRTDRHWSPLPLQRAAAAHIAARDAGSPHHVLEQPPLVITVLLLSSLGNSLLQIIPFIHFLTRACRDVCVCISVCKREFFSLKFLHLQAFKHAHCTLHLQNL